MVLVRVVGVKRYTDHLGVKRAYWRRKGAPSVAIDPELTGAALAAEIDRLEKKHLKPTPKVGTLRLLITGYKARSDHWRLLRPRTRKDYERVYSWLGAALDLPLVTFTAPEIVAIRDKARDAHGAKFANQVVTTLKMAFRFGIGTGDMRENPAEGLERSVSTEALDGSDDVSQVREPVNRPLQLREILAILDNAPARLLPAIVCGLYFCLREGDVVALLKSARENEWLTTLQRKSRRMGKPAKPVTVFICDDAARYLDAIPANDAVTLCVKVDGTPWTLEGFKTAWGRYRDGLEQGGLIDPGVTFHGLRHTAPTMLEDVGFDEGETKHLLGHGPRSISGHYGMTAERKKLLREMALTFERLVRDARGNVVQLRNGGV
jgi:integrase